MVINKPKQTIKQREYNGPGLHINSTLMLGTVLPGPVCYIFCGISDDLRYFLLYLVSVVAAISMISSNNSQFCDGTQTTEVRIST